MKFKKLEEKKDQEVTLYPYLVVKDDYIDLYIRDDEGISQTLLSIKKNGMLRRYWLDSDTVKKWGVKVDDMGKIVVED